jgi:hypothetical protein
MNIVEVETLSEIQKEQIVTIWNKAYPSSLKYDNLEAFDQYLSTLNQVKHYLIKDEEQIIAWLSTFVRENEKWFAVIVEASYQKKGMGLHLIKQVQKDEKELNGWVIDHHLLKKSDETPYISPLQFYLKNDFELLPEIRLENEKISAVKIRWNKDMSEKNTFLNQKD